ncbi:hypothetical protein ACE939_06865 [Aquimarina sp. W85]|uniref:hypothetical protein n=1 Tax=Aquimarina rhodophyticola TaxID=3342246 RepID=UPI0036709CE5
MKENFILIIAVLYTAIGYSQLFPILTDAPISAESIVSATFYTDIANEGKKIGGALVTFESQFGQRLLYLNRLTNQITSAIIEDWNRLDLKHKNLKNQNEKLAFFSFSRKKVNTKLLVTIDKMLTNIKLEIDKQSFTDVLHGEQMNLYQDMMESLSSVDRLLDEVASGISRSNFLDTLTNKR